MPNGLFEVTLAVMARGDALAIAARPLIGVVAAVLAAVIASYAGWHLTDRVVAWRRRADGDGL